MREFTYVTYAIKGVPSNSAGSHPGIGWGREKAECNALYWANQLPWVRTVSLSRAPQWAIDAAIWAYEHTFCGGCHGRPHEGRCLDAQGNLLSGYPLAGQRKWAEGWIRKE